MNFFRIANSFRVTRVTGPSHNFLGLEFTDVRTEELIIEPHPPIGPTPPILDHEKVKQQVLRGVDEGNVYFGTKYVVKRIEFVPNDSPPSEIYKLLAYSIVERLAHKLPFPEGRV
ncbi:MAG TPA: hypothetical protein VJ063_13960 [Verrucomicrobiae bacterium]|nr:hypothetical protein [Verrucomicrobiae bacterium]